MKIQTNTNYGGTIHCSRCHGEHIKGTSYVCMPMVGNLTCKKCLPVHDIPNTLSPLYNPKPNYCSNCGHKL